jgi:hypothetical protein
MAAILKKGQFRNPPAFLPRPLLRAGNQPRQGESIPPDKLFRPASPALVILIIWILLEIVSNFVQQTPPRQFILSDNPFVYDECTARVHNSQTKIHE